MNNEYRPNYKEAGRVFGKNIKEFANYLSNISNDDIEFVGYGNLLEMEN